MSEANGAVVGAFVGGMVVTGVLGVLYVKARRVQIRNALGAAALLVLNRELATLPRSNPSLAPLLSVLTSLPQIEAIKRELAYDVLADGIVNGVGL